jgi:hypothetical protein
VAGAEVRFSRFAHTQALWRFHMEVIADGTASAYADAIDATASRTL